MLHARRVGVRTEPGAISLILRSYVVTSSIAWSGGDVVP